MLEIGIKQENMLENMGFSAFLMLTIGSKIQSK